MRAPLGRCIVILCSALAMIVLPGCSDDGGGSPVPAPPTDANVVNPELLTKATGRVDYCTDPTPARQDATRRFNHRFKRRGLSATIKPLPANSRDQRRLFLQRKVTCDVYDSDVIWMAEWAARGRVFNMRPYIQDVQERGRNRTFIPNTLKTAEFGGRYWGVPHTTNAGFLFYRTDVALRRSDRATWKAVYDSAKANAKIVYQGSPPEPLTVNFLEIAFAAGGRVLSRDGRRAVINSQKNVDALQFMVDGLTGAAPRDVLSYDEEETKKAFQVGDTYMRNWPDKYAQLNNTALRGRYDVAPLPIFDGGGVAGVIGGTDLVIDAEADNPGGALALIDFLIDPGQQKRGLIAYSEPAVLATTYDDPDVRRSVPFAGQLFRAIRQGRPRPLSPAYYKISDAISKNVYAALSNPDDVSPKQALKQAQADINEALASAPGQ